MCVYVCPCTCAGACTSFTRSATWRDVDSGVQHGRCWLPVVLQWVSATFPPVTPRDRLTADSRATGTLPRRRAGESYTLSTVCVCVCARVCVLDLLILLTQANSQLQWLTWCNQAWVPVWHWCNSLITVVLRQTAGIVFTHRPKNQVFRPAGASRCTDSRQTWQGRRARGSAWLCKISPQLAQGVGMRPQNIKKNSLFGRVTSQRRTLWLIFSGFYTPNHPTSVSQIWNDSLHKKTGGKLVPNTSYGYCWDSY